MNCEEIRRILVEYHVGELDKERRDECKSHLENCPGCLNALLAYQSIIAEAERIPRIHPSPAESMSLSHELDRITKKPPVPIRVERNRTTERLAFLLASIMVFTLMSVCLRLESLSLTNVLAAVGSIRLSVIALAAVAFIFVTSFLPVVVISRRKPINGMALRR